MSIYEEVKGFLKDIKEENENFSKAKNPEEAIEALKEMMEGFMQGAQRTREQIDSFNDLRWRR